MVFLTDSKLSTCSYQDLKVDPMSATLTARYSSRMYIRLVIHQIRSDFEYGAKELTQRKVSKRYRPK